MGDYVQSVQAQFERSKISCGVVEMHHLPREHPTKTVFAIANHLYHKANPRPASFVVFSDVVLTKAEGLGRGQSIAAFIKKEFNKGELFESRHEINPRTGNVIAVWCWAPDHEEVRKWYADETMHRIGE